jgi:hypothetical protein
MTSSTGGDVGRISWISCPADGAAQASRLFQAVDRCILAQMTILLLSVALVLAAGCGTDEASFGISAPSVVLDVDLDARRHRVGRLIGWNIGAGTRYSPPDGRRHPEWRSPEIAEMVRRLSLVRAANRDRPIVRFSGLQIDGALGGDGYHFFDFADPSSEVSADDNVAPFEYMAIIDEIDAEPLIMLNFGSGTSAEAARYARHLTGNESTDPMVAARIFWGRDAPWAVSHYEIGNEIYEPFNTGFLGDGLYSYANPNALDGGDPLWYGRPASDVDDYTERAIEYVEAVLEVQPDARFYIPLTQSTWDGWGGPSASLPALAPLLELPAVAGVVVHQYVADDGRTGYGWEPAQDAWLLSSADFYRPLFRELATMLDSLSREEPLELTVTEYFGAAQDRMGRTFAADLSIADLLMLYADAEVDLALEHMTLAEDPGSNPIVQEAHKPFFVQGNVVTDRPSYTLTKLVADHLWQYVATVNETLMPTARQPLASGGYEYDLVSALALVSDDDSEGSVLLLNRDLTQEHVVELTVRSHDRVTEARGVVPDDVWIETLQVPGETVPTTFEQQGARVRVVLPPHSFAAIAIERSSLR